MKRVEITQGKYKGEHIVYDRNVDSNIPIVSGDYFNLKDGDWLEDGGGLVVQVLEVKDHSPSLIKPAHIAHHGIVIVTCLGRYRIVTYSAREFQGVKKLISYKFLTPDFSKPRLNYNSFLTEPSKLTPRDKLFLVTIFQIGLVKAWEYIYLRKYQEKAIERELRKILAKPDAKEYIMSDMMKALRERHMDTPEYYLDKIQLTLLEGVDNPTKLVLFKNLASLTNNPEINNLINPEQQNRLPGGGGVIPLPEGRTVQDASFTEVKEAEELKV